MNISSLSQDYSRAKPIRLLWNFGSHSISLKNHLCNLKNVEVAENKKP